MSQKYIISACDKRQADGIAWDMGLDKNEYYYVNNNIEPGKIRQKLYGFRIENPKQLIGNFTTAEHLYLTAHLHETFNFSKALELMKQGKKVKRKHWGGYWFIPHFVEGYFKGSQFVGNNHSFKFNEMIVACLKDSGGFAPASPYQEDILAEDWVLYIE